LKKKSKDNGSEIWEVLKKDQNMKKSRIQSNKVKKGRHNYPQTPPRSLEVDHDKQFQLSPK
jgi:hypothetical protein